VAPKRSSMRPSLAIIRGTATGGATCSRSRSGKPA
jgi:hypothetical protein